MSCLSSWNLLQLHYTGFGKKEETVPIWSLKYFESETGLIWTCCIHFRSSFCSANIHLQFAQFRSCSCWKLCPLFHLLFLIPILHLSILSLENKISLLIIFCPKHLCKLFIAQVSIFYVCSRILRTHFYAHLFSLWSTLRPEIDIVTFLSNGQTQKGFYEYWSDHIDDPMVLSPIKIT